MAALPDLIGHNVLNTQQLLGLGPRQWYELTKKPDDPIANQTLAIHVRLLNKYPSIAPSKPSFEDLQDELLFALGRSVPVTEICSMLGLDPNAHYNWTRSQPSNFVAALLNTLMTVAHDKDAEERLADILSWRADSAD